MHTIPCIPYFQSMLGKMYKEPTRSRSSETLLAWVVSRGWGVGGMVQTVISVRGSSAYKGQDLLFSRHVPQGTLQVPQAWNSSLRTQKYQRRVTDRWAGDKG